MKLIQPSIAYEQEIRAFRRALIECGDSMDGTGRLRHYEQPEEWISFLHAHEDLQYLYVREEDSKIVGMIQIRPVLNPYLETYGGHIGYCIVPDERRKGYATRMLANALQVCRDLKISSVLITCLKGNEGSRRTIVNNGCVFESTVYEPDEQLNVDRYWIQLSV